MHGASTPFLILPGCTEQFIKQIPLSVALLTTPEVTSMCTGPTSNRPPSVLMIHKDVQAYNIVSNKSYLPPSHKAAEQNPITMEHAPQTLSFLGFPHTALHTLAGVTSDPIATHMSGIHLKSLATSTSLGTV